MTTTPQDRRTAAALAFAEAAWKLEKAERAGRNQRPSTRAALAEAEYRARADLIGAEQAWFEVAAEHDSSSVGGPPDGRASATAGAGER